MIKKYFSEKPYRTVDDFKCYSEKSAKIEHAIKVLILNHLKKRIIIQF